MIQVDDLSISYSGEVVFKDVSFTLQQKERCGLMGRNGSGKTTLLRVITGQEKADKGTVSVPKGYRLGYLDQHIRFSKPTLIEEACLGLPPQDRDDVYKAETILFGLGFKEEDMELPPSQFSGGYHLRLHLTKVLLSAPDCLLLDEPTNYLDIVSIRWLMRFLQQWKGEFILISHDREFMDGVTTHTLGIHREKMKKVKGSTIEFAKKIILEEEIHERTRVNVEKKRAHLQSFVDRFGAKASKAAQAQSRKKQLERIPVLEELKALYHLDFNFHEHPFMGKKMLEAKDVDFSYQEDTPLIENLSLTIEKGERIGIIGKNGRGKSTILRLLTNELNPQKGEIKTSENLRIGYFGQTNISRLDLKKTIEEEISSANPALNFTEVRSICGLMMFGGDRAKKTISVLSGGERSRVLLGGILAKPCNLLLLDEPTHHLDMESIEALIDALEDFEGSVIIVTHSELILKRLALDKLLVCHLGKQELFLGGYEEFLEQRGWVDEGFIKPKKTHDPKESKRKRSELIADRSKALKPLELEMTRCEKAIATLESEQGIDQQQIIELSSLGPSQKLKDLLKKAGERDQKIQSLYQELEKLSLVHETKKQQFDKEIDLLDN